MELQYCREFVTLAQTGNYLTTADNLYISQSTLSRHIQQLEKDLGHPLFHRSTRHIQLTRFGELYLEYARQIVAIEDQFQERLRTFSSGNGVTVFLVYLGTFYHIPEIIHDIRQIRPEIEIATQVTSFENGLHALNSRLCDFMIVREPERTDEYDYHFFAKDTLQVILSAQHPLAGREEITLRELASQTIALSSVDHPIYMQLSGMFVSNNLTLKVSYWDSNILHVLDMVSLNSCVSIVSKSVADAFLPQMPSVRACRLADAPEIDLYILTRKDPQLSRAARYVLDTFIDYGQQMLEQTDLNKNQADTQCTDCSQQLPEHET